jgi:hypothetical protein
MVPRLDPWNSYPTTHAHSSLQFSPVGFGGRRAFWKGGSFHEDPFILNLQFRSDVQKAADADRQCYGEELHG